jgi:hypothetical protein
MQLLQSCVALRQRPRVATDVATLGWLMQFLGIDVSLRSHAADGMSRSNQSGAGPGQSKADRAVADAALSAVGATSL